MKQRIFPKKQKIFLAIALFYLAVSVPGVSLYAQDGAALFKENTCNTCHGTDGKGMFREKTKETYRLKTKHLTVLKKAGHPVPTLKKLLPLRKKKFTIEAEFVSAIEKLLGKKDTLKLKDEIIKIAGKIYYKKGDPIPGFELYPKLAGNNAIYMFRQIKDILNGVRTNGNTNAMLGIKIFLDTKKATDKEFKMIAEYLSKVK